MSKVSAALAAVVVARQSVADVECLRDTVANWRRIASDPDVTDEQADQAVQELVKASEELRLIELSLDRRKAAVERAIAHSVVVADDVLSSLEMQAFHLEREATALGFDLCRKLIAPGAAALSVDVPGGVARERAIGGMVFHLRGVYEATDLLDRVTAALRSDSSMRCQFACELLMRWEDDLAVIAAGLAAMRAAVNPPAVDSVA